MVQARCAGVAGELLSADRVPEEHRRHLKCLSCSAPLTVVRAHERGASRTAVGAYFRLRVGYEHGHECPYNVTRSPTADRSGRPLQRLYVDIEGRRQIEKAGLLLPGE